MNYTKLLFLLAFLTLLGSVLDFNLLGDHKEEPIDLIQVSANIMEYMNYQMMELFFSTNNVNSKLLQDIEISRNGSELFNIKLNNCTKRKDNSVSCVGDFRKIQAGIYTIIKIKYDNKDIYVKNNIYLEVHKKGLPGEDLKLLEIKGETNREENNIVTLTFNKVIKGNDLSDFYLVNIFNDTFQIPFKVIKQDNTSLIINLNLDLIIEDKYFIYFKYAGKLYYNYNKNINIIDKNKNNDFILTKILYNFDGGEKDQLCYLFFDALYPKSLQTLSFCDYYSNKIKVDATCTSYYTKKKVEEKCLLDLTKVEKGNYYLCEYYWQNGPDPLKVKTKNYYKVIVK
jgi:hypothetical protein